MESWDCSWKDQLFPNFALSNSSDDSDSKPVGIHLVHKGMAKSLYNSY